KKVFALAADLIKSKDPMTRGRGYLMRGQALAQQGLRTEGIVEYVKGLELFYPGKEMKELAKMVKVHPAFQEPDALPKFDERAAQTHFGRGLEHFWGKRWKAAEAEFKEGLRFYNDYATIHYYLGLARLQQKDEVGAKHAFRRGAELEAVNRPHW